MAFHQHRGGSWNRRWRNFLLFTCLLLCFNYCFSFSFLHSFFFFPMCFAYDEFSSSGRDLRTSSLGRAPPKILAFLVGAMAATGSPTERGSNLSRGRAAASSAETTWKRLTISTRQEKNIKCRFTCTRFTELFCR